MAPKYDKIHCKKSVMWLLPRADHPALKSVGKAVEVHQYVGKSQVRELLEELESPHTSRSALVHPDVRKLRKAVFAQYQIVNASGGIVRNEDGDFLMIHRKGFWDLPKGKIERNEKKKAAARREVEEETNVRIKRVGDRFTTTYHIYREKGKRSVKRSYWFEMEGASDSLLVPQLSEDIEQVRWVAEADLADLLEGAYPSIREIFERWFKAHR